MARICALMVLMFVLGVAATEASIAREQDEGAGLCWDPDIEFPVPCDEDEE